MASGMSPRISRVIFPVRCSDADGSHDGHPSAGCRCLPGQVTRAENWGEGGPFFDPRASLGVVGRVTSASPPARQHPHELLDWLLRNGRREEICATVVRITGAPAELVEDALQDVCRVATSKCRGTSRGEVYNWLLKATLRRTAKLRGRSRHRREILVDLSDDPRFAGTADGADVEVLARERERELAVVAGTVVAKLNERQRNVAALHSRRVPAREIAKRLGTSERSVKRLREQTFARARQALVEAAGGGCERGEPLISRFSFGLATPRERTDAQLHLAGCERCGALYQRLELVHEKIAALLPMPVVGGGADPGLVEQAGHTTAHGFAQVKQQLAEVAGYAKHHAIAGYTRAVEYTPMATVRPGAAATAIAGCLAVGGGAAGYCIDRSVDPVTGFVDIIQPAPTESQPPGSEQQPVAEPLSQPPATPPPAPAPAPAESQPTPQPEPKASTPPPPPPEPTPAGVEFGEPATASQTGPSTGAPTSQRAQPAPAPETGGTDLYGP
jgi:RNA polymerase sigma factor (sigma-70 family)